MSSQPRQTAVQIANMEKTLQEVSQYRELVSARAAKSPLAASMAVLAEERLSVSSCSIRSQANEHTGCQYVPSSTLSCNAIHARTCYVACEPCLLEIMLCAINKSTTSQDKQNLFACLQVQMGILSQRLSSSSGSTALEGSTPCLPTAANTELMVPPHQVRSTAAVIKGHGAITYSESSGVLCSFLIASRLLCAVHAQMSIAAACA